LRCAQLWGRALLNQYNLATGSKKCGTAAAALKPTNHPLQPSQLPNALDHPTEIAARDVMKEAALSPVIWAICYLRGFAQRAKKSI